MSANNVRVQTDHVILDVALDFGPRILGLTPRGDENLFAELGDLGIDLPDDRRFSFRGGHRLWLAPEVPEITYVPDDAPVSVRRDGAAVSATGIADGIEKTIRIEAARDSKTVTVDHVVVNRTDQPLEIAVWAITQLRPGGTALLPIAAQPADPHGLQASGRLIGWPYTDWGALEADPESGVIHINGTRSTPTKIGTPLTRGWLAYVTNGWLFAKYADYAPSGVDLGATGETYVCADFVELETLGPQVSVAPGGNAKHREVWRVWPAPPSLKAAAAIAESFR